MDILNLLKNTYVTIFVTETTTNEYVFCDNKILPDLTNVVVVDKSMNVYNAYTRLQPNANITQFIDKTTNTPIPNVFKVHFYPFMECVRVFELNSEVLSNSDVQLSNSSNGVVCYVLVNTYNVFFYEIKTALYIKNGYQTIETHANICTSLQFYVIECLRNLTQRVEVELEVIDKNKIVVYATAFTQK